MVLSLIRPTVGCHPPIGSFAQLEWSTSSAADENAPPGLSSAGRATGIGLGRSSLLQANLASPGPPGVLTFRSASEGFLECHRASNNKAFGISSRRRRDDSWRPLDPNLCSWCRTVTSQAPEPSLLLLPAGLATPPTSRSESSRQQGPQHCQRRSRAVVARDAVRSCPRHSTHTSAILHHQHHPGRGCQHRSLRQRPRE